MSYLKTCVIVISVSVIMCINSCNNQTDQKKVYNGINAKLYKNTPAWNLVHSMDIRNWELAKEEIRKDSSLSNFIEPLYGNSLLFWAALNSNDKAVQLLLNSGAEVNKCNFTGNSPIEIAAFYNNCDSHILQMMLEHQPGNDSLTTYLRNEALIAASKNCLKKVKLLINYKANPSWVSIKSEVFKTITPLAMSVIQEKFDIVEYYLIELNVDPSTGSFIRNNGDTVRITEQLHASFSAERTFDQEKTRQQINKILDFLAKKGYK